MKRALITIATVGILAPTAWVAGANAQYGSPAPPAYSPPPAYNPSPTYAPAPRYTRRAYRRTARQTYRAQTYPGAPPAVYAGGTAFTPGSGGQPYAVTPQSYAAQSAQPNETRQYVHDPRRYQSRLRLPSGVQEVSVWQEPRVKRGFFFAGRSARHRAAPLSVQRAARVIDPAVER